MVENNLFNQFTVIKTGGLIFKKDKLLLLEDQEDQSRLAIPTGEVQGEESLQEVLEKKINEAVEVKGKNKLETTVPEGSFIIANEAKRKNARSLIIICKGLIRKFSDKKGISRWVKPREALELNLNEFSAKAIKSYLERFQQKDYLAGWKRCKADFENYQKKVTVLLNEAREKTAEDFALEIIPVLNNFDLALKHVPQSAAEEAWVEGIFYIQKQLAEILSKKGIHEIKALGEKFDPAFHECLEEIKTEDKANTGKVIKVMEKGYCQGDKVIKAAKVKIAR